MSQYYNLSKTSLLYFTHNSKRTTTTLKLFTLPVIKTARVERVLQGEYRLQCIFDNGVMLLVKSDGNEPDLIMVCPNTLATLSLQLWRGNGHFAALDNDRFFIIDYCSFLNDTSTNCKLTVYQRQERGFSPSQANLLTLQANTTCASIQSVIKLGPSRYGCRLRGHNTAEFSLVLFDIDINDNVTTILPVGTIKPKGQYHGSGSAASGILERLPNEHVLTYHSCHDNVQIWDTHTLSCIKEWNWAEITTKPDDFFIWCLRIVPILNTGSLLVYQSNRLFIFNIYSMAMKPLHIKSKIAYHGLLHALPNGECLAFVDSHTEAFNTVLHLDTDQLVQYRTLMGDYAFGQQRAYRFFNTQLPLEITEHMMSYAFNPQTQSLASQKASLEAFDNDSSSITCQIT